MLRPRPSRWQRSLPQSWPPRPLKPFRRPPPLKKLLPLKLRLLLLPLKPNLRLVKGAYLEPASVAHPKKEDVDAAFIAMMETSLRGAGYTAIATHDGAMIDHAIAFTEREGIGRDRFEFQLLYGVRAQLQLDLLGRGYKVLVATPFGPEWFPFFTRRLAERPANLLFLAKNLFAR